MSTMIFLVKQKFAQRNYLDSIFMRLRNLHARVY